MPEHMRKYIFFCCAAFFWLAGTGHAMQVVDRIVAVVNGEIVLLSHDVRAGDIWRACTTQDEPVRDWVRLMYSL